MALTLSLPRKSPMSGVANNGQPEPAPPARDDIYEWEILIEAPFAFDFFRLLRAVFRFPTAVGGRVLRHRRTTRRGYYLGLLGYNVGLIVLILLMIPFLMLAFSYVATLPFLLIRLGASSLGERPMAAVAAVGLVATLSVPIVLFLLMLRPTAYRDYYKRSKVELFNILIALALFLASGMLEALIASPALRLRNDYQGSIDSTMQWTLFFADRSMNVLFANLPQKFFGPLSDIAIRPGRSEIALAVLRTFLLFGFVALIRLLVLKLCVSKKELFYGSLADLRSYLDYCGKAEARTLRRVIPMAEDEVLVVRNKYRVEAADEAPAGEVPALGDRGEVQAAG